MLLKELIKTTDDESGIKNQMIIAIAFIDLFSSAKTHPNNLLLSPTDAPVTLYVV